MAKKVLIVDDEAEIVELISMVLDDGELDLLTAYDGEQALRIIHDQHPHVVLSDVMMPRLDGRELCKQIKADPTISHTVIILMSAAHRVNPSECGADELIRKPFDIVSVMEIVNRFLKRIAQP